MWHPRPVSPKSKGPKKGRAQQARQAGAQQIRARQVLPLRVLTAQDADGVAAKLGQRRIPRDRCASYRTLVDQLWAGDPPEIAKKAMRMAADGLDRDVSFGKLMKDTSIRA